jgi:enoyl-CoA hydratase/carnithine racemase
MDLLNEKIVFLYVPLVIRLESIDKAHAVLEEVEKRRECVLVIRAKDPNKFCVGMDLKNIKKHGLQAGVRLAEEIMRLGARILNLPCPVISVINGHCIAGGMVIAFCADYIIMNQDSGFLSMSEIFIGIVVPSAATLLLKQKIRPNILRDLFLRGKTFNASEALKCHLIDESHPKDHLLQRAEQLSIEFLQNKQSVLNPKVFRRESLGKAIENCAIGNYDANFVKAMINDGFKL